MEPWSPGQTLAGLLSSAWPVALMLDEREGPSPKEAGSDLQGAPKGCSLGPKGGQA